MRPDTITLAIQEKYTPEEKAEIAGKLAIAIADLENIREEKKVSDSAYNARMKTCDGDITALAKQYNKGGEVAQIGCDIRYDNPEVGKKSYFRMDTGELVETHDMTWEEKQETIQFPLATTPAAEDAPSTKVDDLEKALGFDQTPAPEPFSDKPNPDHPQDGAAL